MRLRMEDLIKSAGAPFGAGARAKARVALLAFVRRGVAERLLGDYASRMGMEIPSNIAASINVSLRRPLSLHL